MAESIEAIYRDSDGREAFRETLTCDQLGVPTAVRHRNGIVYLLIAERKDGAIFQQARDQGRWNGDRSERKRKKASRSASVPGLSGSKS